MDSAIMSTIADITAAAVDPYSNEFLWIIIVGFLLSFILSMAVGANDCANSFGTSVGSGVLTLTQACLLATVFEVAGSVLLGMHVVETIRKGIVDIDIYAGSEQELMLGYIATLAGCAVWLFTATYFKLPVSASHSTVSATLGFTLAARGTEGIKWKNLTKIALSWVVSPLTSGLVSIIICVLIEYFVIRRGRPLKAGLIAYPIIWALAVFVNVFGVTNEGPEVFYLHNTPLWVAIVIALVAGFLTGIIVQIWIVPFMRNKVVGLANAEAMAAPPSIDTKDTGVMEKQLDTTPYHSRVQIPTDKVTTETATRQDTEGLFSSLQILTAIFASFAHGGNDVANSVGPLVALWMIYSQGQVTGSELPKVATMGILFYGGVGIVIGLWLLGRRVIETVGQNLTKIRPSTGFTIEIGSACTVLLASKLGLPVSTTHCKIGSVVFVGYADSKFSKSDEQKVNWKLFGGIFASWVATVPAALGCSALFMWILKAIFL